MRKVFEAGTKDELDKTFAAFVEQNGRALVVQADPFFWANVIRSWRSPHTMPFLRFII